MSKPKPASVGVALIARNAGKTLGDCLKSLRPYVTQIVVGVDESTTDDTHAVAKRAQADTILPIKVSDWHECAQHGRVLAQHFAQARNQTFEKLDRNLDFWLWVDSDDVLANGENLPALCKRIAPDCIGAWFPYEYSTARAGDKAVITTQFARERLFRTKLSGAPVDWTWQFRVHEVCQPSVQAGWVLDNSIRVVHQPRGHTSENSARRNLFLLEIDYEDNPESGRTVFYIGNQYFAMGNWEGAAYWYEQLVNVKYNPYEFWQANLYLCKAYQKLERPTDAIRAAFVAMEVYPQHPEPYWSLAEVYAMTGESEKVLHWTKEANGRVEPPFFVFRNPADYSFNCHLPLSDAYNRMGRIAEARQELEIANSVLPSDHLKQGIENYRKLESSMQIASGFALECQDKSDNAIIESWEQRDYPKEVRQFGRCRDVVIPAYLRRRVGSQPRIVFFCGRSHEPWAPPKPNETGIGGSETAVIEIAKRFCADGWKVDVYNDADYYEGEYEGVGYWDCKRYRDGDPAEFLISWRQPALHGLLTGDRKILWCHDLNYGAGQEENLRKFDVVAGVSEWHANKLHECYGVQTTYLPNGVDLNRFKHPVKKVPWNAIYASSPDRGLVELIEIWNVLADSEPTARLHICYGFENIDKMIANGDKELIAYRATCQNRIDRGRGIVWHGRTAQDKLAELYQQCTVWLYPTHFLEVSCISAMEAMAAGAVPVTSAVGALPSTIGDGGYVVNGNPYSRFWKDFYVTIARATMAELNVWKVKELAGKERVKDLTWDKAYEHWKALTARVLEQVA